MTVIQPRRIAAAGIATLAALAALLTSRWAGRRYEREYEGRLAGAVAAYLAIVTPPPLLTPGDSDLDLAKLLIRVRGLAGVPPLTAGLEVYHGTVPLRDARSSPLPASVLEDLRARDVVRFVGQTAVSPLKDRDDWNVVGAVAVGPTEDRVARGALSGLVPFALLVWVVGLGWTLLVLDGERRRFRTAFGACLAGAALVGAAAGANVTASARTATDRWLDGTRLLIQEAARLLPARTGEVATGVFARIARGAELTPADSDAAVVVREVRGGVPRARLPVRIAHGNHWLMLRALPLEIGSGEWVVLTLGLALLGPAGLALLRWVEGMRERPRTLRETVTAWGFLAPAALHLAVFSFAPMLFALYLSVHRWSPIEPVRPFVGLTNFLDIARDPLVWISLRNTVLYTLHVPVAMALALAIALALTSSGRLVRVARTAFFLPYVSSVVAVALVWQWMYHPDFGLLNYALRFMGLGPVDWLGNPRTALIAVMGISIWVQVGYQMVVFLAGLQGIPKEYLDAARVDGAGAWRRFWRITFPLLKPVTLFVLVTGIITSFQVFTFVYVLTDGGPLHATDVIVYRIYQIAWEFLQFGRASALALLLFLLLLGLTWTQFRLLDRRGGEHVA